MHPGPGKSEPFGILNRKSHPNGLAWRPGPESPDFTEYDFVRQDWASPSQPGRLRVKAQAGPVNA